MASKWSETGPYRFGESVDLVAIPFSLILDDIPHFEIMPTHGDFARFEPGWGTPDKLPSLFTAGREIGDEYRYILERRYVKLFPGNMLARPGLLLNPWEKRSTVINCSTLTVP